MVYKRYVKIKGKVHGPYYYKSYRDKNGKVVSKYVKDYKPEKIIYLKKEQLLIALIATFIILLFFGLNYFDFVNKLSSVNFFPGAEKNIQLAGYDINGLNANESNLSDDNITTSNYDSISNSSGEMISQGNLGIMSGSYDVTDCGNLDESNSVYTQIANIIPSPVGNETCINITADNITFNGNGYYILNNSANWAVGIRSNSSNTTIENCNVTMQIYGMKLTGSYDHITNCILNNQVKGLSTSNLNNSIIDYITASND